jgi:hypothetical protein
MLRADLTVVLRRRGVVGEPRRESMIRINQLRFRTVKRRVVKGMFGGKTLGSFVAERAH